MQTILVLEENVITPRVADIPLPRAGYSVLTANGELWNAALAA
jgi:hypothetical protein